MKYCTHCGTQLTDTSRFCKNCGKLAAKEAIATQGQPVYQSRPQKSGLATAAMVLMIVATVSTAIFILPLAWYLPMTIYYCQQVKAGRPVGTGFKVCTMLFVSMLAGILMLCDE